MVKRQLGDEIPAISRYVVRQSSKGYMVYDRQRKNAAILDTKPVVGLSKEEAERIKLLLIKEAG